MSSFLRRREPSSTSGDLLRPPLSGEWGKVYPALVEFLSATAWDDGTNRAPGTLTVFTDGAAWKCCLADKDQGMVCFVTGPTPGDLFDSLEHGLVHDALDWRTQRQGHQKGNRKSS